MFSNKFRIVVQTWMTLAIFLSSCALNVAALTTRASQKSNVSASQESNPEEYDSFIIEFTGGHSTCREARLEEIPSTLTRPGDSRVPVEVLLPNKSLANRDNALNGLTINFVALSQLQSDPNRDTVIAAFQRAAAVWTDRIKSPITISIDIDYGVNSPGGGPFGGNTLGSTSSRRTQIDYPGARINLLAGSSGSAETTIYNLLPNSFLPTDVGNGGVVSVNRAVAFALGIPVTTPSDLKVATMGFNKNFSFDFNPDDGITFGQTDFVAVATHEIGHALGFTSGSGGSSTSILVPTLWDLFRFRPGTTAQTFTTAQRVMAVGGDQVYFTTETFTLQQTLTNELKLSTGGPDAVTTGGGDGRQSSHWKDNSFTGVFIGIMDPTIPSGTQQNATANDFAALETIGWNLISSVPPPPAPPAPPPPANDNFANAQVIAGCSGTVAGTNIGATAEAGEVNHSPDGGGGRRSVWYRWQSPISGSVTVDTAGSRFDTVLGVYTGTSPNSVTEVAPKSDDISGTDKTSTVTFTGQPGTTYRIAVDGYDNGGSGGDFGPITLNWNVPNCSTSQLMLMLAESGPLPDLIAAIDGVLFVTDPFPIINSGNLISPASDRNTRVLIFVKGLSLSSGQPASSVVVSLVDSNNQPRNIAAEDVRPVPNFDFTQVTFRLPNDLAAGTYKITVVFGSQSSNTGSIRIGS
jgi:hypothetical protein